MSSTIIDNLEKISTQKSQIYSILQQMYGNEVSDLKYENYPLSIGLARDERAALSAISIQQSDELDEISAKIDDILDIS